VLTITDFSVSSVFSSLFIKELILNPEEMLGFDSGFEAFLITSKGGCSGAGVG